MGELGISGRRYFRKGGDERTHQIHVFEETNRTDIIRHLAFRNYLRTHSNIAEEYCKLKIKLSLQYPDDIEAYCKGKDSFVKKIERDAILWSKLS